MEKPHHFTTEDPYTPPTPEKVLDVYRKKLMEGRVGAMVKVVLSDPNTKTRFYQLFEDRQILESAGINAKEISHKTTPLVVTLMRDPSLRSLFLQSALGDMRDRSHNLKDAIHDANNELKKNRAPENLEKALVFNRVVIGGGVHGSIFNTAITRKDVDSKNVTVEGSDVISKNFSTKQFVAINSRNQPHMREEVPSHELQRGNLNFFGKDAPVQVPYIEPELFPSADVIAEVSTANQYLSNSEMLFESKVDRIIFPEDDKKSSEWPARYKVLLGDGSFVFTDEVVLTTGLGEIRYPKEFDTETLKIIKRDSEISPEGAPPGVMTYEEFGEFTANSPTPTRHFANKKIDIAGGGDGAATVLEELFRFGKRKSYKLDVAQTGVPAKAHWIGQKIQDSRQYKNFLKNERYLMLAQEMPLPPDETERYEESYKKEMEKRIEPIDGHFSQMRDSDDLSKGRYRVVYSLRDGSVKESYTDFVIIAAGYKNMIGSLFGEESNPFENSEKAEAVRGELGGVPVPVAVKLKNHDIYAAGPASIGQVLKEAQIELASLSGIPAQKNLQSISIATFGPRTEQLAEILAKKPHKKLQSFDRTSQPIEIKMIDNPSGRYAIRAEPKQIYQENLLSDIKIKIAVGRIFDQCNIVGTNLSHVDIIIEKDPKNKQAAFMSFSPNINNAEQIKDILVSEGLADDLIHAVAGSRWYTVINVPFNAAGKANIQDINLKREKATQ